MSIKILNDADLNMNKIKNTVDGIANNDGINVSQLDENINSLSNQLSSKMLYAGQFDASIGNFTSLNNSRVGSLYKVIGENTIEGVKFKEGDFILINTLTEIVTINEVELIKNTEFDNTLFLDREQTITNKTIDAEENLILNISSENIKNGLSTDLSVEVTDQQIPSALAAQNYVSQKTTSLQNRIEQLTFTADIIVGGTNYVFDITHNLISSYPIVRVINSNMEIVFPYVKMLSENSIQVNFDGEVDGNYKVIIMSTGIKEEQEGLLAGEAWILNEDETQVEGMEYVWDDNSEWEDDNYWKD